MEILGKTKVLVQDGKVVEVGHPQIQWCPLWNKVSGTETITRKAAKMNMQKRIDEFGMFTSKRRLDLGVFASFGISEVMMSGLKRGLIDSTVTVCDGAGTVVTSSPALVQGMSAQISGLIDTEPIPEIIAAIQKKGSHVLDPESARIDQPGGLELAVALGYKRIAVSIVDPGSAAVVRDLGIQCSVEVILMAAHLTGISKNDAVRLMEIVDIITGCASGNIRDMVKPLIQVGDAIPLFGLTPIGKELLIERAKDIQAPILLGTMDLPVLPRKRQPGPLVY
jgi:putative methanogenesis marker protein 8